MKPLITFIILIAIGGIALTQINNEPEELGAKPTVKERVSEIDAEQVTYESINGKYKQYPEEKIGNTTVSVSEYVGPNGPGYLKKEVTVTPTSIITILKDSGPEPYRNRTYIQPIIPNPATTTIERL